MKRNILALPILLSTVLIVFSGCKRGEEDPWLTFHTRDARMTQPWVLTGLQGTRVETTGGTTINTEYTFDGTGLYITTDGVTKSYTYTFKMDVRDNGEVFSEETRDDLETGDFVSKSSRTGFWYWGNDDKNKTSVYLELTGLPNELNSTINNYDIPRLAWNDMTLDVATSDNYTDSVGAHSVNLNFTMQFEIDLDALAE